ncbi:EamA family transporter RarD [Comamonas endophytica]|uniref:EamA family transporter RarD n=1 Tax=Comamonas endophytica TaxID=2949090 RepID=A0ABY6G9P0_9BURK|nr:MULTISPECIES: EamA family transporter RarD [unclassified Acidovorax]MCD2514532.1 EamA family transporter RarD [Acidovorax sp. D4N7]UYG51112.1 EamA family transporter RarD [Acidovorax sp. 5MLIR]
MLQGIVASVLASMLFGTIYWLSTVLQPLDGEQIFGWRVLVTLPFTSLLLLARPGEAARLAAVGQRVRVRPGLALLLVASSALLGVQLWLFMWAPLQGRALPVSLGYFLLPLTMVLVGRLFYGERLSRAQGLATLLAALGVAHEIWQSGAMSWETWIVALGYPAYFALRRRLDIPGAAGQWLDMALMLPVALWFIGRTPSSWPLLPEHPALWALLPLLGVISTVALALYLAASRRLPLGLFGLLSYVEPVLLVLVALLLGESLQPGQGPTYVLVFAAIAVLLGEGVARLLRQR